MVCGVSGHYDELRRRNQQRADEVLHALLEVHFAPVEQAVEEDAYENWGGQQGFQEAKEKAKAAKKEAAEAAKAAKKAERERLAAEKKAAKKEAAAAKKKAAAK